MSFVIDPCPQCVSLVATSQLPCEPKWQTLCRLLISVQSCPVACQSTLSPVRHLTENFLLQSVLLVKQSLDFLEGQEKGPMFLDEGWALHDHWLCLHRILLNETQRSGPIEESGLIQKAEEAIRGDDLAPALDYGWLLQRYQALCFLGRCQNQELEMSMGSPQVGARAAITLSLLFVPKFQKKSLCYNFSVDLWNQLDKDAPLDLKKYDSEFADENWLPLLKNLPEEEQKEYARYFLWNYLPKPSKQHQKFVMVDFLRARFQKLKHTPFQQAWLILELQLLFPNLGRLQGVTDQDFLIWWQDDMQVTTPVTCEPDSFVAVMTEVYATQIVSCVTSCGTKERIEKLSDQALRDEFWSFFFPEYIAVFNCDRRSFIREWRFSQDIDENPLKTECKRRVEDEDQRWKGSLTSFGIDGVPQQLSGSLLNTIPTSEMENLLLWDAPKEIEKEQLDLISDRIQILLYNIFLSECAKFGYFNESTFLYSQCKKYNIPVDLPLCFYRWIVFELQKRPDIPKALQWICQDCFFLKLDFYNVSLSKMTWEDLVNEWGDQRLSESWIQYDDKRIELLLSYLQDPQSKQQDSRCILMLDMMKMVKYELMNRLFSFYECFFIKRKLYLKEKIINTIRGKDNPSSSQIVENSHAYVEGCEPTIDVEFNKKTPDGVRVAYDNWKSIARCLQDQPFPSYWLQRIVEGIFVDGYRLLLLNKNYLFNELKLVFGVSNAKPLKIVDSVNVPPNSIRQFLQDCENKKKNVESDSKFGEVVGLFFSCFDQRFIGYQGEDIAPNLKIILWESLCEYCGTFLMESLSWEEILVIYNQYKDSSKFLNSAVSSKEELIQILEYQKLKLAPMTRVTSLFFYVAISKVLDAVNQGDMRVSEMVQNLS